MNTENDQPAPDDGSQDKQKKEIKATDKKWLNYSWALKIFIITFVLSACLSFASESVSEYLPFGVAVFVLILFVLLGIVFDILGLAVATATGKKFNSMATKKVRGARAALWLIAKADIVSNFCNDVVGDVSSVLSGAMTAFISVSISSRLSINVLLATIIVTALTSAITVGGKALGKNIAMNKSNEIVILAARIMCFIIPEKKFINKG